MASGCKFFDEDAVFRINKRKLVDFGLVLENSEFVSSDEEDSDEKNIPEWDRMKRGHVRVAWHPKGVEEVLPEKKVKLFDRSLMPGDVVRKLVKGKDTQLGYCRNTNVRACVQVIGTKQVVAWVDSKDLMPVEDFSVDIAVFLNSWVGMVKAVKCEITVKCSDGSRGVMLDIDAFDLDDLLDRRDRTSEYKKYSFYPGQQLWGPSYCFENVKWSVLNKEMEEILLKPSRSIRVTVEDVKIVSLGVQWVCRAYSEDKNNDNLAEQPCYHVTEDLLKEVKMMNIFEPCALQIGNRNFLVIKEIDRIMSLEEWRKEMALTLGDDSDYPVLKKKNSQDSNENKENVDLGVRVEQNGVYEHDSESEDTEDDEEEGNSSDSASVTSHSTASSVDKSKTSSKHKSRKGFTSVTRMLKKKKLKRARRNLLKEVLPLKAGDRVVTETLIIETKANVVWQDGSVETDIPSSQLYPIHHLDGHEFFPGDFVIESKDSKPHEYGVVKNVDHSGRTASVAWMKTYHAGADPHPETITEQEVSVFDIEDHPDFKYRPGTCVIRVANFEDSDPASTAGQVVDVHPTGKVKVSWINGKMSLCYPQELYRVGEYVSSAENINAKTDDRLSAERSVEQSLSTEFSELGTASYDKYKINLSDDYEYFTVTLTGEGFGFRIVKDANQFVVENVIFGETADLHGRLQEGDTILAIDDHFITGAPDDVVVNLMNRACTTGRVSLEIRRKLSSNDGISKKCMQPVGFVQRTYLEIQDTLRVMRNQIGHGCQSSPQHSAAGYSFDILDKENDHTCRNQSDYNMMSSDFEDESHVYDCDHFEFLLMDNEIYQVDREPEHKTVKDELDDNDAVSTCLHSEVSKNTSNSTDDKVQSCEKHEDCMEWKKKAKEANCIVESLKRKQQIIKKIKKTSLFKKYEISPLRVVSDPDIFADISFREFSREIDLWKYKLFEATRDK